MASPALEEYRRAIEGDWQSRLANDEWFLANLERHVLPLSPAEAFEEIAAATDLLLDQTDHFLIGQVAHLVYSLARVSDTTERLPRLIAHWDRVMRHHPGKPRSD